MNRGHQLRSGALLLLVTLGGIVAAGAALNALAEDEMPALAWLVASALATLLAAAAGAVRLIGRWRRGEPVLFAPAHARLLFCSFTVAALLQFSIMQPFRYPRFYGAVAMGYGVFAVGVAFGGPLERRWPRSLRALDIAAMNAGLFAVVGELALRLLAHVSTSPVLALEHSSAVERIRQRSLPPGQMRFGFPINSDGYYDGELSGTRPRLQVVSIGDSFSVGAVPHAFHFTTVAERGLPGCAIYNIGVQGTGPREYLWLVAHKAMPLKPDLIVVNLYVGNDLMPAPESSMRLWLDRENLLIYQVPRRLARLAGERNDPRSAVGRGAASSHQALNASEVLREFPWVADPTQEIPSMSRDAFLDTEAKFARKVLGRPSSEFRALFGYLEQIRDASGGTPLLIALIPSEYQVEEDVWTEVCTRLGKAPPDRDEPQRIVTAWLAGRGIPHVDYLPLLRSVPPLADGRRHVYHLQDTHLNARGNRVVGEALSRVILSLAEGRAASGNP